MSPQGGLDIISHGSSDGVYGSYARGNTFPWEVTSHLQNPSRSCEEKHKCAVLQCPLVSRTSLGFNTQVCGRDFWDCVSKNVGVSLCTGESRAPRTGSWGVRMWEELRLLCGLSPGQLCALVRDVVSVLIFSSVKWVVTLLLGRKRVSS